MHQQPVEVIAFSYNISTDKIVYDTAAQAFVVFTLLNKMWVPTAKLSYDQGGPPPPPATPRQDKTAFDQVKISTSLRSQIVVAVDFLNYVWSFVLLKIFIQICKLISFIWTFFINKINHSKIYDKSLNFLNKMKGDNNLGMK
jgi:hypothetical protein